MNLGDSILLAIVDKLLIAGLILIIGAWLNRSLEQLRARHSASLEIQKQQQNIALETLKAERARLAQAQQLHNAKRVDYLEKQLSEFYWPLYALLAVDAAVQRHLNQVAERGDMSQEERARIEGEFLLEHRAKI